MPTLTPAPVGSGTLAAATAASGTEIAASAGSGTLVAATVANGNGLYCSESLACSDVDVICTDADGINPSTASTGSLVAA